MYEEFEDYTLDEIIEMYGEPTEVKDPNDYEDISVYGCLEYEDEDGNRYINALGALWLVTPEIYGAEDY